MMRVLSFISLLLLLGASELSAQRVEFAIETGYFVPTMAQFTRLVPLPVAMGLLVDTAKARLDPGVALGGTATLWPFSHLGLDLGAGVRISRRSVSFALSHIGPPPDSQRTMLAVLTLRPLLRASVGGLAVRAGAGPAIVHLGHSASGSADEDMIRLLDATRWAATFVVDVLYPSSSLVSFRLRVEDAAYRVAMVALPPGGTRRTPLQHDLVLSLGVALTLGGRDGPPNPAFPAGGR